ncbi:MAG: glycosyltransferase family 2 protein [Bacteroidota bacterium]
MPELLVILVNFRRPGDTVECVASLQRSAYTDFEILVVDNASGDGSADFIAQRSAGLHILAQRTNLGFAGGNNVGLRMGLRQGYRFFLLLNNDTIVDRETLGELVSAARGRQNVGIVGPKIYFHDRPETLWFAGGRCNIRSGAVSHRGMHELDRGQYDAPGPCDFITGCCALIRREALEGAGMLDEDFFAYYEDCDYALRVRNAGYDVMYHPTARLWHKVSSTAQWDSPVYHYLTMRNRLFLVRKHSSLLRSLPFLPSLAYAYVRQLLRLTVKARSRSCIRAAWAGLADGLSSAAGRRGPGRISLFLKPHGKQ